MFRTFANNNGVVAGAVEQSLHSAIIEGPPAQDAHPHLMMKIWITTSVRKIVHKITQLRVIA